MIKLDYFFSVQLMAPPHDELRAHLMNKFHVPEVLEISSSEKRIRIKRALEEQLLGLRKFAANHPIQ